MKRITEIILIFIFIAFAVVNPMEQDCAKSPFINTFERFCCPIPFLLDGDVTTKCLYDMQNRTDTRNSITKHCVFVECIEKSNQKQMADDPQISNPQKFLEKRLGLIIRTDTWLNIGTAAFDKCLEKATTNIEKFREMLEKKPYAIDLSVCDPIYMYRFNCFVLELFKNCPASLFEDNETCNEWKNYLNDCGDSYVSNFKVYTRITNLFLAI